MLKNALIPLCLAIFSTSCGTSRVIEKPVLVETVRIERVNVPAELLVNCAKSAIPDELTFGGGVGLWADDRACVDILNGQIEGIRVLNEQGTD